MSKQESKTLKINHHSYLYSLELEGIHCFKDWQSLDLSNGKDNYSPWTIILGDNGTGKTTLLKVLDRMQPFEDIVSMRNVKMKVPLYLWNQVDNKDFISKELKADLKIINNKNIYELHIYTEKEDTFNTFALDVCNVFLLSYGASRRMSKSPNVSSMNNKDRITSLFDDSIELINAEEWFLQKEMISLKSELSTKEKFQRQFNLVKSILIDILPDVEDIRVKPINENNSKLLLEVNTPYGWVNLRNLSFGYQTLTALIVDIAAKMMEQYPDSENPLAEPVIILIDEIDLHLHPKWQRTVLDKLSEYFPKAQFIATSHSPLIVQAAQDKGANIVVCRKEGDKVIIDNNPDEVKGWRIDQILVSDLFEVESSRSANTQKKVDEYINSKGLGDEKENIKADLPEELKSAIASEPESELDKKLKDFANKYLK